MSGFRWSVSSSVISKSMCEARLSCIIASHPKPISLPKPFSLPQTHFHPQTYLCLLTRLPLQPISYPQTHLFMYCIFTRPISIFTAQCTLVHMRGLGIACRPSVRLSVPGPDLRGGAGARAPGPPPTNIMQNISITPTLIC